MAFSIEDLNDLLELLRKHPQWRDAVRREVLTQALLELPETVQRLADSQVQLTADVNRLTVQMQELTQIVQRLDGRVGNLEGWRYEQKFNARGRVTEIVRRPVEVELADLDVVVDAREERRILPEEWKQLLALDFLFRGRMGKGADAPECLVALEVSQVVDSRDVQRAHDRAAILARLGLKTIPAVGGTRFTEDAVSLAEQLGVRTLMNSDGDFHDE